MKNNEFPDFPIDDIGDLLDDDTRDNVNVDNDDTGTDDIAHLLGEPDSSPAEDEEALDKNAPESPQEPQNDDGGVVAQGEVIESTEGTTEPSVDDLFSDMEESESPITTPEWDANDKLIEFSELMDEDADIEVDNLEDGGMGFVSPKDAEIGEPEPLFSDNNGKSIVKIDYSKNLSDDDYSLDGDLLESGIADDSYRIGILNTENTSKPLADAIKEERDERNDSLGDTIPAKKVPGKPYVPIIIPDSEVRKMSNDRYSSKELNHSASHRSLVSSMSLIALVVSIFIIIIGLIFYFVNRSDEVTYEINSNSMELSSVTYNTKDGDVSLSGELAPFSATVKVPSGDPASISAVTRNVAGEAPMISCTITRNGESITSVGMGGVTCNL